MAETIDKRQFLAGLVCPTRGWFVRHAEPETESAGLTWRFHSGRAIGELARETLGPGLLLPQTPNADALAASRAALANPALSLLFEASFQSTVFVARADALRRNGSSWDVLEVKSGKSPKPGEKPNADYVDDLAFTTFVARSAGLSVGHAILVLVNRDYRIGAPHPAVVEVDVSTEVLARADAFAMAAPGLALRLLGDKPAPEWRFDCRDCDYLDTQCLGAETDDHLFVLPRLAERRFVELRHHERISRLPADTELTPTQQRVANVVRTGAAVVEPAGLSILEKVVWPAYYLDFEAVMPPLPWFEADEPYEVIPFQYSLDRCDAPGAEPAHFEYLAPLAGDWRRELIERLLAELGDHGSIVVYSSYEKTRLSALARLFPDLKSPIEGAIARLFDLERVFRDGYCHPGFRGRTSIKKVLPVMVNDLSYEGMSVGNGEDAAAVFALMKVGVYAPETHDAHRANLLAYCGLDTKAMVRLHQAASQLAS